MDGGVEALTRSDQRTDVDVVSYLDARGARGTDVHVQRDANLTWGFDPRAGTIPRVLALGRMDAAQRLMKREHYSPFAPLPLLFRRSELLQNSNVQRSILDAFLHHLNTYHYSRIRIMP